MIRRHCLGQSTSGPARLRQRQLQAGDSQHSGFVRRGLITSSHSDPAMSRATKVSETPKRRAMRAEWSMKRSAPFWKTKSAAIKEQPLKAMLSQSHSIAMCDTHGGQFRRISQGFVYRLRMWKPQALDCFAIMVVEGSSECRRKFLLIFYFRPLLMFLLFSESSRLVRVPARCFESIRTLSNDVISLLLRQPCSFLLLCFFALLLFKTKCHGHQFDAENQMNRPLGLLCRINMRYPLLLRLALDLPQFQKFTSTCILDSGIHTCRRRTSKYQSYPKVN
jgi:hypothetical protein